MAVLVVAALAGIAVWWPRGDHDVDREAVNEYPVATDRFSDLDGYTASIVDITETHSLAPILARLPGGHCRCPHWGYLFRGRMIVHYDDRDEVIEEGQAFYIPPGHVPEADTGTEFVLFSPTDQLRATEEAVARGMQETEAGA